MPNRFFCLSLIIWLWCNFANAQPKSVHIDAKSTNRTICQLEFAKIEGLIVDAKYVDAKTQSARVNIERYSACPYAVEMKYFGVKLHLDFGTAIKLKNVRSYDPVWPVDTGYFVYDGNIWQGASDVVPDEETKMEVRHKEDFELVSGTVHRQDPNRKTSDYCFALTLVHTKGYAIGGACSKKKSDMLPLNELFKKAPVTLRQ